MRTRLAGYHLEPECLLVKVHRSFDIPYEQHGMVESTYWGHVITNPTDKSTIPGQSD